MSSELDNDDNLEEKEEEIIHSSIYDPNIGLPVFPSEFRYKAESNYDILATMTSAEDVEKFILLYAHNSGSEWRVLRTYTKLSPRTIYKRAWRCQYNVQQRSKAKDINRIKVSKNCDCPGYICITVFSSCAKRGFEDNWQYKNYRARIKLNLDHNHDLNSKECLRKRTLDPNIKDKIVGMFQYGHGASASIKLHLLDLLMINEDQYTNLIHDGRYMPSVSQIQHFLNHYKKDATMVQHDISSVIEDYLLANPEAHVDHFCIYSKVNKVVTIISPLMLKAHQHIPRSGDVINISLSNRINRLGTKLLVVSTHWELGPLPLGLVVIQENDGNVVTTKANFAEILTQFVTSCSTFDSFYGKKYPQVIITDEDLVPLVSGVWTKSLVFASHSSVLKTVWTWLQDSSNNISFAEREGFYFTFKKIMFSSSAEEVEKNFTELSRFCVDTCPSYLKYVESLMLYQHVWVEFHQKEKLRKLHLSHIELERSHDLEIFPEYVFNQMLVRIQNLFQTLPEVLDFVLNHLESYYCVRILKLLNYNFTRSMRSKYLDTEDASEEFALQPSDYDKDCYFVMNKNVYHYVDYRNKFCSTNVKNASNPCCHINAVLNHTMEMCTLNDQDLELSSSIRHLCQLLLSEHYRNLSVDEHSVIVINTDTRHLICENSDYPEQTEMEGVNEIVIATDRDDEIIHKADDEDESDSDAPHETISPSDVEIVTVNCTDDFDELELGKVLHVNLEDCSKLIRSTLHEASEEGYNSDLEVTREYNTTNETRLEAVKQKPPDKSPSKYRKRKRNTSDSAESLNSGVSRHEDVVQIIGSTTRLVSLKRFLDQYPHAVSAQSGKVLQEKEPIEKPLEKPGLLETERLKVQSIVVPDSKASSQAQSRVNQTTGEEQVTGIKSTNVLTGRTPRLTQTQSMFSLSDNVIIIDPHFHQDMEDLPPKKFKVVDCESDLKKFNRICEKIQKSPSQYKTVLKNMIDVYETFYGDV